MPPETYTEEEVNRMLAEQRINMRLDGVEIELKELIQALREHMHEEDADNKQLINLIESGANERRRVEKELHERISENDTHYNNTFVKHSQLRLYVVLVITAVTFTSGAITYFGNAAIQLKAIDVVTKKFESIMDDKIKEIKR